MTMESIKFSDVESIKILFEITQVKITQSHNKSFTYTTIKLIFNNTRKQSGNEDMIIRPTTKITHYMNDTKNNAEK